MTASSILRKGKKTLVAIIVQSFSFEQAIKEKGWACWHCCHDAVLPMARRGNAYELKTEETDANVVAQLSLLGSGEAKMSYAEYTENTKASLLFLPGEHLQHPDSSTARQ